MEFLAQEAQQQSQQAAAQAPQEQGSHVKLLQEGQGQPPPQPAAAAATPPQHDNQLQDQGQEDSAVTQLPPQHVVQLPVPPLDPQSQQENQPTAAQQATSPTASSTGNGLAQLVRATGHSAGASAAVSGGSAGDAAREAANETGQKGRAAITEEMNIMMQHHFATMDATALAAWQASLQVQLNKASSEHHQAKEVLKRVDAERSAARDNYRADQQNSTKQNMWKTKVAQLKEAQAQLKTTREAFYRASAGVDAVTRQIKVLNGQMPAGSVDKTSGIKRKRTQAPEEGCPYCNHNYTVRDGLSAKTDDTGMRLHLRKCQCREKTPPCRNCPKCKDMTDIMSISDTETQKTVCQLKFKCDICSCQCPGAGKWIESDDVSRQSYSARTALRHNQLEALGWGGTVTMSATFSPSRVPQQQAQAQPGQQQQQAGRVNTPDPANVKRPRESRRTLKRLPHDIRMQLEQMQVPPELLAKAGPPQTMQQLGHPAAPPSYGGYQGGQQSQPGAAAAAGDPDNQTLVIKPSADGLTATISPPRSSQPTPPPPVPAEVVGLVNEVFTDAAGSEAASAVRSYLQNQRVTSLNDLQYLELQWLQDALAPSGLTPLLLNKFLAMAKQRIAATPQRLASAGSAGER